MEQKKFEGVLESVDPKVGKNSDKEFWVLNLNNGITELNLTCWNDLLLEGFSTGSKVTAYYTEKQNGIYTNRNLIKLVDLEAERESDKKVGEYQMRESKPITKADLDKEADYDKIAEERVKKIVNEEYGFSTNIVLDGVKYEVIYKKCHS